ncbi:hypothetical protein LQ327_09835 [Actinomycetospora endophytica]|uniref:Uncharacterized protein n=1 Tax=Actinomycetospora endophytica TaxID=2291215 RepID=A0ABS8P5Y7_9PSEU|nr:hypothetical protein [Actinomycetospora endophytica]MCD2193677.1 hypothetical protein [Actinomycetospora endophytica]
MVRLGGSGWSLHSLAVPLLGVLVIVLAVALISTHRTVEAPSPSAASELPPPYLLSLVRTGVVSGVNDDGTVEVTPTSVSSDGAPPGAPKRVTVAGLQVPAAGQCGHTEALDAARSALMNEAVTLVPDPAVPVPGVEHVVTHDQWSWTDHAISEGMGQESIGGWTYAGVFEREQREASGADRGLWATCWAAATASGSK